MSEPLAYLTARFIEADKPNKNGHIYPTTVLEHVVETFKDKTCGGMIGMPATEEIVPLNEMSHVVNNIRLENGYLVGNITILKTPMGSMLMEILPHVDIAYRTAGTGKITDVGTITEFQLTCIAAVPAKDAA